MRAALISALTLASACAPNPRGPDFRAIGQEPGWHLEIEHGRRMTLVADYGERRVVTPAPQPETDPQTGSKTYRVRTEAHNLTVTIEDKPCRDVMSGEPFPATVTVDLDGREYRGCGGPPQPTTADAPRRSSPAAP